MSSKLDSRQIKKRQSLKNLGTASNAIVETILDQINTESDSPLRLSSSATPDAKLNFASSSISAADSSKKIVSPVKKQIFATLTSPWINFQDQTNSNAAHFDITFPASTVGQFRNVGFTLIGSGKIKALFSAENAVEASLSNPGALFINGGLPLGYVTLECTNILGYFKTAGSVTNIIESSKIFRLAAGGGGSSSATGGAGGGELSDLLYQAAIRDSFSEIPDGSTTISVSAGMTDASLHDVANELIRISYDASRTVTGTGTSMTLSSWATPVFTIKIGDMLIVGTEARKITAIPTQTTPTIEAAFTVNPAASACNVSQAVHTVDLNAFTAGGLGLAANSQFAGNIEEILVGYDDTSTLGDIIPNFGVAPVISYSASADLTNWTTLVARVNSLSTPESFVTMPVASTNLGLRFFSNAVSGSGAVNLLGYKVFFHKQLANIAGASYLTAFARPTASIAQNCAIGLVSGKTRFTFTFPYTMGLNSGEASGSVLEVSANGQIVPRYSAGITDDTQAFFKEINSSTIEMDTDYTSAGIDFQFKVQRVNIIDTNTQNTVKNALHDDLFDQNLDAQVIVPVLTAINGTPVAGTSFRSDITGRANIPDLSSMLSVQMGPARMQVQDYYQLQSEFGPTGQPVFGVVNDKFNQMRFVGSWTNNVNVDGAYLGTIVSGDYAEIVFWGTGINICFDADDAGIALNYSVDGGSPTALTIPTYSVILGARNYAANQIVNIVSGLSLGLHTIKIIQNATVEFKLQGLEFLTETTSLRVMPGTVAKGKYKNVLSSIQTVAYDSVFESGTLGTRGGCVLVYLKNDETIGKALTPTDSAAGYLTGASHTNEEIIRTIHWREFGAGRADDFSLLTTTLANLAFTLDDGVTTLVGYQVRKDTSSTDESLAPNATGAYVTLTFIGTGLSINLGGGVGTPSDTFQCWIDGVNQGNMAQVINQTVQICSGLPYGTHTVKILRSVVAVGIITIKQFNIYAPKKPALPVGAIELAQYYKIGDYVANTTATITSIAKGVIGKAISARESIFVGTWGSGIGTLDAINYRNGLNNATSTNGSYFQYNFFGTGFEFRFYTQASAANWTVTVTPFGGSPLALNSYTTNLYQANTGLSFAASTGIVTGTVGSAAGGNGLQVSGLPLQGYTLKIIQNTASINTLYIDALDIITPIHAPAINGPYVVQNTLTLGNNSVIDLRKFNKRDLILANQNKTSQAFGVNSSPTIASTAQIPVADLSITHNSLTGKLRISYANTMSINTVNFSNLQIFIDGKSIGTSKTWGGGVTSVQTTLCDYIDINVSIGVHKIDVYGVASAGTTITSQGVQRNLTVEDI